MNIIKKVFCLYPVLITTFTFSQVSHSSIGNKYNHSKYVRSIDYRSTYPQQNLGLHTHDEWQTKIDSTWGSGLPTSTKLQIFDEFWTTIDEEYPSFHNINVNWDSLNTSFRPEVKRGVSRGRFYAIMSQLFFALRDFHTRMVDIEVARTELKKGVPLLVPWGYWDVGHFGAALAPNPDSSLFVYEVVDNHPLNLKIGDIILGYDGVEWKNLYKQMYKMQFPLAASMNLPFKKAVWGTTPSAFTHIWLCSAGMNWHLFDTIDVVKYSTKDTLHLSTDLLENKNMELIATGQIPNDEIPMPDIHGGHSVSYGVIKDNKVGYIYNYGWHPDVWELSPGDEFRDAINKLKSTHEIEGLIIDARITDGGAPEEFEKVFPLLFNEDQDPFLMAWRYQSDDHFKLAHGFDDRLSYKGNNSFDHPIAVLTGPVAQSMGDIVPFIFGSHPKANLFGLPTNGAFGYVSPNFNKTYGSDKWEEWITLTNMCLKEDPSNYLTHVGFAIDDTVWLELEDVVKGKDSVVETALAWIDSVNKLSVGVYENEKLSLANEYKLEQNYPNPFNPTTTIKYQIPDQVQNDNSSGLTSVRLNVFDILGREVATLVNQKQKLGHYEVNWDGSKQPSGVYFYKLKAGSYTETRKMMLLK